MARLAVVTAISAGWSSVRRVTDEAAEAEAEAESAKVVNVQSRCCVMLQLCCGYEKK